MTESSLPRDMWVWIRIIRHRATLQTVVTGTNEEWFNPLGPPSRGYPTAPCRQLEYYSKLINITVYTLLYSK